MRHQEAEKKHPVRLEENGVWVTQPVWALEDKNPFIPATIRTPFMNAFLLCIYSQSTSLTLQIRCIQFKHSVSGWDQHFDASVNSSPWHDAQTYGLLSTFNRPTRTSRWMYHSTDSCIETLFAQRCSYVFLVIRTVAARRGGAFRWDGNLIRAKIKALADWST